MAHEIEIKHTHKTLKSPVDAFSYGFGEAIGKGVAYGIVFAMVVIGIGTFTGPAPKATACAETQP
jgi:hypothetical protein